MSVFLEVPPRLRVPPEFRSLSPPQNCPTSSIAFCHPPKTLNTTHNHCTSSSSPYAVVLRCFFSPLHCCSGRCRGCSGLVSPLKYSMEHPNTQHLDIAVDQCIRNKPKQEPKSKTPDKGEAQKQNTTVAYVPRLDCSGNRVAYC
jgi:hypothetical protein